MNTLLRLIYPAILLLSLSSTALAQGELIEAHLLYEFEGETHNEHFGAAVSGAGDVNADGYDDFVIGAPFYQEEYILGGKAYIFSGRTGTLLRSHNGDDHYIRFGYSVAGAGDVDNDGYDDVIIGAPGSHASYPQSGKVIVYSGRTGEILWNFSGVLPWESFGWSVSGVGDVDDDGHDDFMIGTASPDTSKIRAGRVNLYSGRTGEILWSAEGEGAGHYFGEALSAAGDVNADGYPDVIIGARLWLDTLEIPDDYARGKAYVFSGPTGELLYQYAGAGARHYLGSGVSGAGDVDLDGHDDFVVGSPMTGDRNFDGHAYVFSGRTSDTLLDIEGFIFGSDVSDAGDINKDGFPDILVWSSYSFSSGRGTAHVFSGQNGELLSTMGGLVDPSRPCRGMSAIGDVNNDGYPDVVVGWNPFRSDHPDYSNRGRAYVYSFAPPFGSIAGRVSADCPVAGTGVYGVTVDLFATNIGDLVASTVTDIEGNYEMDSLTPGDYTVSIITPLGYSATADEQVVLVSSQGITTADFNLTCASIIANPSTNFWMHQIGVALGGPGSAQIDAEQLCSYLDLIEAHFNSNEINQVLVYEPPASGECIDKLGVAKSLLNLHGNVGMTARAKQQLMALLLNVAAGNISQTAIISEDGATVSQGITFCDNLIDDAGGDHELAKDICDQINNNILIAAGLIPLNTANITYKFLPGSFELMQNYPNPFNPKTRISFVLPVAGHVSLDVYNILGEKVTSIVNTNLMAGQHTVTWDGSDVASGVYFYRLRAGKDVEIRKMLLLK